MRQGGAVARRMSSGNQVRVGQNGATSRTCSSSSLTLHSVCASRLTGGIAYLHRARGQLCASASMPRGPSVREKYSWQWEDSREANRSTWASPNRLQISQIVSGWSRPSPGRWAVVRTHKGDQLRDAGLPPDVVETILSARAPSTRRSYAFKWHIFENWCMAHHVDPVHCQVVSVLEFLEEKLSSGTCPGTLRVYVAAISACHVLIDGVSVGKHPLVARFIRGAKRLRPPTRVTVPS